MSLPIIPVSSELAVLHNRITYLVLFHGDNCAIFDCLECAALRMARRALLGIYVSAIFPKTPIGSPTHPNKNDK